MDILWYIVQKMGCYDTDMIGRRLRNAFSRLLGTSKSKIFPPAPVMVGPPRDTISNK